MSLIILLLWMSLLLLVDGVVVRFVVDVDDVVVDVDDVDVVR
jgi:hypothetical protein